MQPLAKNGYTREEVLRALRAKDGTRELAFRYDLLDRNNAYLRALTNVTDGSVSQSYLSDIKRTARFTMIGDGGINFASDRIIPWVRLKMPFDPTIPDPALTSPYAVQFQEAVPDLKVWYRMDENAGTSRLRNSAQTGADYDMPLAPVDLLGEWGGTFEQGIDIWNCLRGTIEQSDEYSHSGTYSGKVIPTGGLDTVIASTTQELSPNVVPGNTYRFTGWMYSEAGWSDARLAVTWIDAGNSIITTTASAYVAVPAGEWLFYTFDAAAPSNSAKGQVRAWMRNFPTPADVLYIDDMKMHTLDMRGITGADPLINEGHSIVLDQTLMQHGTIEHGGELIQGLDLLTFGAWFSYDASGENDFIIDATNSSVIGGLSVRVGVGDQIFVNLELDTGRNLVSTPIDSLAPGTTQHIVVTWASGQEISIFLNGIEQPITVNAGMAAPVGVIVNPNDLQIGKWRASEIAANYFDGRIDEVFLSGAYLSPDQVQAIYEAGRPAPFIVDDFDTFNSVRWQVSGDAFIQNGRVEIGGQAEGAGDLFTHFDSPFDWTEGEAIFQVAPPEPLLAANRLDIGPIGWDVDGQLILRINDDNLQVYVGPNADPVIISATYNPETQRWFRMSYQGGIARIATSPDRLTWTELHAQPIVMDVSGMQFFAYGQSAIGSGDVWALDSVEIWAPNMALPYIPPSSPWDGTRWVEWPQGVFLMSTPTRRLAQSGVVLLEVEAYDQLQVWSDDLVADRFTATEGDRYTEVVSGILGNIDKNITPSTLILPVSKEWEPGTSRLQIMNDLLQAINYEPLFFDEMGVAIARPYSAPADRAVEYVYRDDEDSVKLPEPQQTLDLFSIPNKWVVVVSDADRPALRAEYTNDNPASPTSTLTRGRTITDFRTEQEAADQATLDALVARLAAEASQIFEHVEFQTAIMPMHSHNDVYTFAEGGLTLDAKYSETAWDMPLQAGQPMQHQIRRVVEL